MSANYHTPLPFAITANAANLNSRFGELDSALRDIVTGEAEWPLLATPLTPPTGKARLFLNTSGQLSVLNSSGGIVEYTTGGVDSYGAFTYASNATEGVFTSGAWRSRLLNLELYNGDAIAVLAANQLTLGAGTYIVRITAPARDVDKHQTRLQDITNGITLVLGGNAYASNAGTYQTHSPVIGQFTLTGDTVVEVQSRCTATGTFGIDVSSLHINHFTIIELWK